MNEPDRGMKTALPEKRNHAYRPKRSRARMEAYRKRKRRRKALALAAAACMLLLGALAYTGILEDLVHRLSFSGSSGQGAPATAENISFAPDQPSQPTCLASPGSIPDFSGTDYAVLNGNTPNFTDYDLTHITGETYSPLDELGRCGPAAAMLSGSMKPKEERGSIGDIRPSGWHTARYPELIEDIYLYNRCHLIAYSMTGQNDNPQNLITGTRYFNTIGMLPFETTVLENLDHADNHVLYRVTPYFRGRELVARGVEMEACSVEDHGRAVSFHVFVYNYQPGIEINYLTGESRLGQGAVP